MSGEVQSDRLLFHLHPLVFRKLRKLWTLDKRLMLLSAAEHVEKLQLPGDILLFAVCDGIHHVFIAVEHLRAVQPEAVHCPALDQIFHRSLVQIGFLHPLDKVLQGGEFPVPFALGDHLAQKSATDVFYRAESEADALRLNGELVL